MATSDLNKLAGEFMHKDKLQANPDDSGVRVNEFVAELQAQGADVGRWSEEQWFEALRKLGVPEDDLADEMENLASWGVVDNGVWR